MSFPWAKYFEASGARGVNPFYERELERFLPAPGLALEVGAGLGAAVEWLLERGWRVDALEPHDGAVTILQERFAQEERVRILPAKLEDAELDEYDLAVAAFTLFFIERAAFGRAWSNLETSIRQGGLLAAQFLGPRDDWNEEYDCTCHSAEDLSAMLDGFDVMFRDEVERDGGTIWGRDKHWHIHHVIAKKR